MATAEPPRTRDYFRYLVFTGAERRWGPNWVAEDPERPMRLAYECQVIERAGFCSYFLILAKLMAWMREVNIVYGPGRGSVGGSLAAYCMGIHEIDSLEYGLYFERFLNPDRVSYPDVDIDVSQRHRQKVLQWIRDEFEDENTAVLQVAAFARSGARSTIDMVRAAKQQEDPGAGAVAEQLKRLLPEGSNITGGTKQPKEIEWWIANGKNQRNTAEFEELAQRAGWWDLLMKLDGIQTNLARHAAGVVIVSRTDLAQLPQTSVDGVTMMTGFDMYSLDDLRYLKIDILGLRTLDIISDAHRFCGGDGGTPALMELWRRHRDSKPTYELLCAADTTGVFQVETSGYRRTLKEFQPHRFDDIVQLNALYRPGALDARDDQGRNMVDVFIARRKGDEPVAYPDALRGVLPAILGPTQGIILYQEQSMRLARELAGFSLAEADSLRKAIGKKKLDLMASLKDQFVAGVDNRYPGMGGLIWGWVEASARYSWNKSHSVFYGVITHLTAFFKANRHVYDPELGLDGPGTAGFYAGLINSLSEDKDRQADAIAEARQHVEIMAPDVNIADASYTVADGRIVFGFNGIKGMGEANRDAIRLERLLSGPFKGFDDFHRRLPSVPINMKLSLIRCGAFDGLESRAYLLARVQKPNGQWWTVAEFIKHNAGLKEPRPLPELTDVQIPSERELAAGEMESIGFYVSHDPMADINKALKRLDLSKHWGGEIVTITDKPDKNGNAMGRFTILTPALNKQRVVVFASNWPQCKHQVYKGARVIIRGRIDGSSLLGEAVFSAGDYRHFKVIRTSRGDERSVMEFDGKLETVELAEASGMKVELL